MAQRLERELVRRFHRAQKLAQGVRQPVDAPLPGWVAPAYEGFKPIFVEMERTGFPISLPFGRLLAMAEGRSLIEELLEANTITRLLEIDAEQRAMLVPIVAQQMAAYTPRARPELKGFFLGTRMWFHAARGIEPTAKALALLTAATGVEPLDDGLKLARRRWDERLHRWRGELDESVPGWREIAAAQPVR